MVLYQREIGEREAKIFKRYECAIKEGTRNLAAHFGAFCGELKLPQNGRERVWERERGREWGK